MIRMILARQASEFLAWTEDSERRWDQGLECVFVWVCLEA